MSFYDEFRVRLERRRQIEVESVAAQARYAAVAADVVRRVGEATDGRELRSFTDAALLHRKTPGVLADEHREGGKAQDRVWRLAAVRLDRGRPPEPPRIGEAQKFAEDASLGHRRDRYPDGYHSRTAAGRDAAPLFQRESAGSQ